MGEILNPFYMGLDFGTSGARIAIVNNAKKYIYTDSIKYSNGLFSYIDWINCCKHLIKNTPKEIRENLVACSIDGTSGTLIACDKLGKPLGDALTYLTTCTEQSESVKSLFKDEEYPSIMNTSLGRALRLIEQYGENILLRHQADWIHGWLINNWDFGEEANNIRLGWDLVKKTWPRKFNNLAWKKSLPKIVASGTILSKISKKNSEELGLKENLYIISGTTDSNAAVLAASPSNNEGITVLGSTLVIKCFVEKPIKHRGVSNHRILGKWLCGGSSNSGCAVINKFFNDQEIKDLSNQINPKKYSGIDLRPLPGEGERFPEDDPKAKPILGPRPISDSLYLKAILEGIARIEANGWLKLASLGVNLPKRIITVGGGANNPQWKVIREKIIGIPISNCKKPPALGAAYIAFESMRAFRNKTI